MNVNWLLVYIFAQTLDPVDFLVRVSVELTKLSDSVSLPAVCLFHDSELGSKQINVNLNILFGQMGYINIRNIKKFSMIHN